MKTQHVIFPEDGSMGRIVSAQYSEDKGDFMLLIACIDSEDPSEHTQLRTRTASSVRYYEKADITHDLFEKTWPVVAAESDVERVQDDYYDHFEDCGMFDTPNHNKEAKEPRSVASYIAEHLDEIKASFPGENFSTPVLEDIIPQGDGTLTLRLKSDDHIFFHSVPLFDIMGV